MFKILRRSKISVLPENSTENPSRTKLIVGLGNPGNEYINTFHNVGSMFIDGLIKTHGGKTEKYRDFEFLRTGSFVAVKPLEFMNRSGTSVKRALKYFGLEAKDLIVVHDDSDLELGQYRTSFGRNSAGHKGVESIIKSLKTNQFGRIRVGIRKNYSEGVTPRRKAGEFVLKKMNGEDVQKLEGLFLKISVLEFKA